MINKLKRALDIPHGGDVIMTVTEQISATEVRAERGKQSVVINKALPIGTLVLISGGNFYRVVAKSRGVFR